MKAEKFKLKNGLRVVVIPMKDVASATVTVWVKTGSRNESRKVAGISHFLEHIVFKGSRKRPSARAIAEAVDEFGGEFNAGTGKEVTNFYIKAPTARISDAIDILSDMVITPLIKKEDVEREKGVIKAEIDMYEDLPMKKVHEIFEELVYKGSALEHEIIGTKETVDEIDRNDFLRYRESYYYPENMLVTIAGGVTPRQVFAQLSSGSSLSTAFGRPVGAITKADSLAGSVASRGPRIKVQYKKTDQAHLVVGFAGEGFKHKDMYAEHLLQAILGGGMSSRMFSEVREKRGLAYGIKTYDDYYSDTGSFATYAGVEPKKAYEALKTILREYKKMTSASTSRVTRREFRKAQEYLKGHFALALEDTSEVGDFFGEDEILTHKMRSIEEAMRGIEEVRLEDVISVAKRFFKPERMSLAVIGPFKNEGEFDNIISG